MELAGLLFAAGAELAGVFRCVAGGVCLTVCVVAGFALAPLLLLACTVALLETDGELLDETVPCSEHPVRSARSRATSAGRSFFTVC